MKRIALIALVACGAPAPAPVVAQPKPQPTVEAPVVQTDESRARDFIAKLAAHDYAGATTAFDDTMRTALPKEKLATVWESIEGSAGAFGSIESVEVKPTGATRTALAKAKFEKAPLVLRVIFDDKNRVAGFFVAPGDTAAAWQPPPYAKVDAFEEKRITIGSSPALPGTLTTPRNAKNYPIVVLVHGSGPNDEDETIGALKVFKDLAFGLASHGVAVVRYDKRTHVDPSGVTTQKDEVDDAAHAAIAFARAQPDVDPKRVVLIGHSQGGFLAPRIAKADPTIKGVIILAGSTRTLQDSIVGQLAYMKSLSPNDPKVDDLIAQSHHFKQQVEAPALKPTDLVDAPVGGSAKIPGAYFLEVRGYHPERVAAQLTIPLLVLQGERDYQVTMMDDYPAWKTALAHTRTATFHTYPTLNHAFAPSSNPSTPADYMRPSHVEEQVITDITTWLQTLP